jgi:SagB-type dehydrogenase family enzyme
MREEEGAPALETTVSLFLIDSVSLHEESAGRVAFVSPPQAHRPPVLLDGIGSGLRAALEGLRGSGASFPLLVAKVLESDGPEGLSKLNQVLARLGQNAMLGRSVLVNGVCLASLRPTSIYFRYQEGAVGAEGQYALSRFAYCRNDGGRLLLESPLGHAEVVIHEAAAQEALLVLAKPRTPRDLSDSVAGLGQEGSVELMNLLWNARALCLCDSGESPETKDRSLAMWDFHDLLFHARSRLGRHSNPYGGTYPFKDVFEALPVVKPPMSESFVSLYRPDLQRLAAEERSFTSVLEARRSVREQGEPPIGERELGEFLFRTARIQKMTEEGGVSFRPHPGGGALHELEIYPLVDRCEGLEAGLYHYDPLAHRLEKLAPPTPYVKALLQMAAITGLLERPPQVLLVIAARFQRMQLKYQSMTYSVILKNVGALYQTMYLVATAMGLAPCALGGGHSDLFAQAAGLSYLEETSVGEFLLGSSRAP